MDDPRQGGVVGLWSAAAHARLFPDEDYREHIAQADDIRTSWRNDSVPGSFLDIAVLSDDVYQELCRAHKLDPQAEASLDLAAAWSPLRQPFEAPAHVYVQHARLDRLLHQVCRRGFTDTSDEELTDEEAIWTEIRSDRAMELGEMLSAYEDGSWRLTIAISPRPGTVEVFTTHMAIMDGEVLMNTTFERDELEIMLFCCACAHQASIVCRRQVPGLTDLVRGVRIDDERIAQMGAREVAGAMTGPLIAIGPDGERIERPADQSSN